MLLANPIYDVVFKYLMEDAEIARRFNQSYVTDGDKKTLEFSEKDFEDDELLKMIASRLRKAATEEELLRKIEIEEEVENTIEQHIREKQELQDEVSRLKRELEELKKNKLK